MYAQIRLSDHTLVGAFGPLPYCVENWSDAEVADLDAMKLDRSFGLAGMGFWPMVVTLPASFDPASQIVVDPWSYTLDAVTRTVTGQQTARAMTDDEFLAANPVPDSVTNYQARRAIRAAGLFDKIDAAIRGAGDPDFVDAWDYANVFLRNDPVIQALPAALTPPLTARQVDDLFRAAARFG